MTFIQFLKLKQDRRDITGKFGRFILSERHRFPPFRSNSYWDWLRWLNENSANKLTVRTFKAVWKSYKPYRNVVSLDGFKQYKASRSERQAELNRMKKFRFKKQD